MEPAPNIAPDDGIIGAPPSFQSGRALTLENLSPNYTVDFGTLFGEVGKNYGALLGPTIGFLCIFFVIILPVSMITGLIGIIPLVGTLIAGVLMSMLAPQLSAGAYYATLKQMRGEPWSFGDFFAGFRYWVPLFIIGAISQVIYWACFFPMNAANLAIALMQDKANPDPTMAMVSMLAVLVLGAMGLVVYLFVAVKYLTMAPYLVIDANMNGIDALKGTGILSQGHFGQWFGALVLAMLIGAAGVFGLCVGVLFTMPVTFILMTALYLQSIRESGRVSA
jgi:hypothetical protein